MLFGKWNYHKASRHTHNANAELEEISPYDSQICLLCNKTPLILLLVHSVQNHFENTILILASIDILNYAYYSYHLNSGDHHK